MLYTINIDNNRDGVANDVVYEVRFTTQNRPVGGPGGLTSPVPYLGNPHITGLGGLLQGITALDGPGSEGLTRRQVYTVTEVRGAVRTPLFTGSTLVAVPSNAGPSTFPNYPALAAQGIYTDPATSIRVFAGQRAETFYIDLGAVFDTLNLRRYLPLLTGPGEDNDNVNAFGTTASAAPTSARSPSKCRSPASPATACPRLRPRTPSSACMPRRHGSRIACWDGRRQQRAVRADIADGQSAGQRAHHQHAGQGRVECGEARERGEVPGFYKNPVLATAFQLVYGVPIVPINGSPASNRTDLMSILLKYPGQALNGSNCGTPCSELLRLDLRVPPTAPESQSRLGAALSSDLPGWPNGRRPNDDVTDIAIRVVGGTNYIANKAGDGVNFLAGAPGTIGTDITATGIAKNFPFLPTPYDGKNRRHVDCDETGLGSNPCGPLVP